MSRELVLLFFPVSFVNEERPLVIGFFAHSVAEFVNILLKLVKFEFSFFWLRHVGHVKAVFRVGQVPDKLRNRDITRRVNAHVVDQDALLVLASAVKSDDPAFRPVGILTATNDESEQQEQAGETHLHKIPVP